VDTYLLLVAQQESSMSHDLEDFKLTAIQVARTAGAKIKEAFEERKVISAKSSNVEFKNPLDLVTETDKGTEILARQLLLTKYPTHLFLGEESIAAGEIKYELTDSPTWIVDPIDGTTNFVHGLPLICISIALAIQKEVVVGVIFNPMLDELFVGVKGGGATLNERRIQTSSQTELKHLLIATGFPTDRAKPKIDFIMQNLRSVIDNIRDLRRLGSAALDLCGVACGRLDGYFEYTIHIWDIAAGVLILKEAGGVVLDPSGDPLDLMCGKVLGLNNQVIATKFVPVLVPCPKDLFLP